MHILNEKFEKKQKSHTILMNRVQVLKKARKRYENQKKADLQREWSIPENQAKKVDLMLNINTYLHICAQAH